MQGKNFPVNLVVIPSFRYLLVPLLVLFVTSFSSCSKTDSDITGQAGIVLVNAAYSIGPLELTSSGTVIGVGPVDFGMTSATASQPYIILNAGMRNFALSNTTGIIYNANYQLGLNKNYSLFAFDTINSNGTIKTLLVKDDTSLPDSGSAAVRFFNFSTDAGETGAAFFSTTDTVLLSRITYPGETTVSDSWAAFNRLDTGNYVLNVADTSIQLTSATITLSARKKYTFFVAGRRSDGSLRIYSYSHL